MYVVQEMILHKAHHPIRNKKAKTSNLSSESTTSPPDLPATPDKQRFNKNTSQIYVPDTTPRPPNRRQSTRSATFAAKIVVSSATQAVLAAIRATAKAAPKRSDSQRTDRMKELASSGRAKPIKGRKKAPTPPVDEEVESGEDDDTSVFSDVQKDE
jgi:hypothetical protein